MLRMPLNQAAMHYSRNIQNPALQNVLVLTSGDMILMILKQIYLHLS